MLSDKLDVSPATIRRDLQYLEDQGLLRRTHGGAMLPFESTAFYPHHDSKLQQNQSEKAAIARVAAQRVANGDVISTHAKEIVKVVLLISRQHAALVMRTSQELLCRRLALDSGTTTLLMAREQRNKRDLTIVTTDLKIALELTDVPSFEVICVGGTVRPHSYNTLGAFAEQMLRELHANHAFLGADGIDLNAGITNATVTEVPVKHLLMRCGLAPTLIADHSKFGRVGLARVAELGDFVEIITGPGLSAEKLKHYLAAGARLTIAEEEP
jgi:DeoR/GlpR family transcriptional regulator of sugar metabolism